MISCRDPATAVWYLSLEMPAGVVGERRRLRLGGTTPDSKQSWHASVADTMPGDRHGGVDTGRWLRHWLADRVSLRPSTRRMYDSHLRLYLLPHLDRIPLAALTIADLRATFLAINRQHQALGAPLSATTLHSIRCTLRAALNAAIREGLLTDNPPAGSSCQPPTTARGGLDTGTGRRLESRRATVRRSRSGPAADTARFLAAIERDELRPMLYLVAMRGLRRGEAAGLCWPDLDLDEATLTISRTLQGHAGRPVLLPPKTAASARTLALDRSTVAVLTAHRAHQRKAAGVDRPDGFVFAHRTGRPYSPSYLTHHFRALQELHGLPPIRFHDLRHGAATLALAAGADLKAIQDMLGHASIVLTADTYTSVLPEVARQTAEGIAALVMSPGETHPAGQPVHPGERLAVRTHPWTHHGLTSRPDMILTGLKAQVAVGAPRGT